MNTLLKWFCSLKNRPFVLFYLGLGLLLLLWLLRDGLLGFFLLYAAFLVVLGLLGLIRLIQAVLRKRCWKGDAGTDPKGSGSQGHPGSKTLKVPPHTYKRPDPMIYSQFYLMAQGLAVTWDNPDIQLFDGAAPVASNGLLPSHPYSIRARIWNNSTDAPAVNLTVRFFYLSFGVDTVRHYIGETHVNLAVKGSPLGPAVAQMPWVTPPSGHYCIQVELHWIDDANPFNNFGQENVDVKKLNSPNASFTFAVGNTTARARTLTLRADAYEMPDKTVCPVPTRDSARRHAQDTDPYARHRPAAHPLPAGWQIDYFGRDVLTLQPGEETDVTVKITATDAFVTMQAINVNAFDGNELVGGVTLYVHN
jgi:hypothetical protein